MTAAQVQNASGTHRKEGPQVREFPLLHFAGCPTIVRCAAFAAQNARTTSSLTRPTEIPILAPQPALGTVQVLWVVNLQAIHMYERQWQSGIQVGEDVT